MTFRGNLNTRGLSDRPSRIGLTVRQTTTQSIVTNTQTNVTFQAVDFDSSGFISAPSATITIPAGYGGLYSVNAMWNWAANPATAANHWLRITASSVVYVLSCAAPGNSNGVPSSSGFLFGVGGALQLSAGDTITSAVYHNFGSNVTLTRTRVDLYLITAGT